MIAAVFLIIGYALNLTHEASVVSPSSLLLNEFSNGDNGIQKNKERINKEAPNLGYAKLRPGAKIYFYSTEDQNLMIGPKLRSDDGVTIFVLNEGEDSRKFTSFTNSCLESASYIVLKSGVLVPKKHNAEDEKSNSDEYNKCVYQSLKPTYYVRGFRNILIPVDVLYTKSKQKQLFSSKNLKLKTFSEPLSWRTDLKVFTLKNGTTTFGQDLKLHEKETVLSDESDSADSEEFSKDEKYKKTRKSLPSSNKNDFNEEIFPDKTCDGEVTLFVLENDGTFKRTPSDPYLPSGLRLSFSVLRNLVFKPKFLGRSDIVLSYVTGKNGDLIPHSKNVHKVAAEDGSAVCFMLSANGGMFPVKEEKGKNNIINYYFNGQLVHKSQRFTETYSNATSVLINNKKLQFFESLKGEDVEYEPLRLEENKTSHHMRKREAYYNDQDRGARANPSYLMTEGSAGMRQGGASEYQGQPCQRASQFSGGRQCPSEKMLSSQCDCHPHQARSALYPPVPERFEEPLMEEEPPAAVVPSPWENPPLRPRADIFTFDERGSRIPLIPEITDTDDVVIYKLTCKGNLVRYPPCKEPEFDFDIHFQLLLDEFVLVPTASTTCPFHLTFVLQENGDLVPKEGNVNTFRKAPGSLIYYMLGKNNVLFPVQQVIDMEGNVSFFYQDHFLLKMKDSADKPLHFTTRGSPLFAFFNGFTMITMSSKPRLNPLRGSNWKHLKPSDSLDGCSKTMFLTGPKGELIKIAPYKNKQGSTVVYELDCNGIFYRSPKDKKKCIILKSYIMLKEGLLLPSNDTTGYVYMMSKNGDLFPYLYPEGKIEAPMGASLKYVLCEKGILLPMKLEIADNHICYVFRDTVVYKEKVYCKSCLDRLDEEQLDFTKSARKSSCDVHGKETDKFTELFVNKDGNYVFYEKCDKLLKRYPPEEVPSYLKYTMGSFEVKADASLYQIRYQDPNENVINLMLEPNGDLLEDTRNVNKLRSQYYVLDGKGNLVAVEVKKTKKNLYFYKNNARLCRVPIPDWESLEKNTSEGTKPLSLPPPPSFPSPMSDPLGLMDDPPPPKPEDGPDARSLYIPIPLKSVSVAEGPEPCSECADEEHKKKCEMLKEALKQVSKGTSLPLALELELTDDIIEELKNWAAKCDKVLNRRDVADNLKNYIANLKSVSLEK